MSRTKPATLRNDPLYRRIEDTSPNIKARNACLEIGGQLLIRHFGSGDCHAGGRAIDLIELSRRSVWTVAATGTVIRQRIHAIAEVDLFLVGMTSRLGCRGVIAVLFEAARQFDARSNAHRYPNPLYGSTGEVPEWLPPHEPPKTRTM